MLTEGRLRRYLEMRNAIDPHQRGRDFERLLTDLFTLLDMEPRISYRLPQEQILVKAAFFINVAFMALFDFATPGK